MCENTFITIIERNVIAVGITLGSSLGVRTHTQKHTSFSLVSTTINPSSITWRFHVITSLGWKTGNIISVLIGKEWEEGEIGLMWSRGSAPNSRSTLPPAWVTCMTDCTHGWILTVHICVWMHEIAVWQCVEVGLWGGKCKHFPKWFLNWHWRQVKQVRDNWFKSHVVLTNHAGMNGRSLISPRFQSHYLSKLQSKQPVWNKWIDLKERQIFRLLPLPCMCNK